MARLWWCPVGALTHIPLHAAGHYADPGDVVGPRLGRLLLRPDHPVARLRAPFRRIERRCRMRA